MKYYNIYLLWFNYIEYHFVITLSAEAKQKSTTCCWCRDLVYNEGSQENTFILISSHIQCSRLNAVGLALLLRYSLLLTNYDNFEGLNGANIHFGCNCKCVCCFSAEVCDVGVPDIVVILMMLFLDHRYWCSRSVAGVFEVFSWCRCWCSCRQLHHQPETDGSPWPEWNEKCIPLNLACTAC